MNSILESLKFKAREQGFFAFDHLESGIPKGALVEVSGPAGSGKTEVVLQFLAQNPGVRVAWVEENFTIYPCRFPQSKVGLERVLFVEGVNYGETLWTVQQILRSQVFGIVVMSTPAQGLEEMELRRLQLSAERSQATVVLLSESPARRGTWPIAVQLSVKRELGTLGTYPDGIRARSVWGEAALKLNVLKYRGLKSWQVHIG